jgi:histone H3/H4
MSAPAPRDAVAIATMLKAMGIEMYEPAVVLMLLDVMHGHVAGLLHSARHLADHAGRVELEVEDLRLAAQSHRSHPDPPQRLTLLALARERNATPLPVPPTSVANGVPGVNLPPQDAWLQPQVDIDVELPPAGGVRKGVAEGPWVLSEQERNELAEAEMERRRGAAAATLAAAASKFASSPIPSSDPAAIYAGNADAGTAASDTKPGSGAALQQGPAASTLSLETQALSTAVAVNAVAQTQIQTQYAAPVVSLKPGGAPRVPHP